MAHSGGLEPPTARFVAEYSIQLSYECVVDKMAVREGFEPSIELQTLYSLSRGAPSASRPPHRLLVAMNSSDLEKYVKRFFGNKRLFVGILNISNKIPSQAPVLP